MASSELAWAIQIPVGCPTCGVETLKTVAILRDVPSMRCHGCGVMLDLREERTFAIIKNFSELCGSQHAPIARILPRGKGP